MLSMQPKVCFLYKVTGENYTKQTGKEQIKVAKQVNYLYTKWNKIKQNQEK